MGGAIEALEFRNAVVVMGCGGDDSCDGHGLW